MLNEMTSGWIRGLAVTIVAAFALAPSVHAASPQHTGQAPGFYRMHVGDIEVVALSDGTFPMPVGQLLKDITPEALNEALRHAFVADPVEASVNGFLINTGRHLVLVDSGAGAMFGPTLGHLVSHLRAAGYTPEQVDEIYITHMHGDHVGGLVAAGKAVFPNALVRAAEAESGYWLDTQQRDAAPESAKGGFTSAMTALGPYVAAGRYKPFHGSTELVPGVEAIEATGHTPGHTAYRVSSRGDSLLLWGDLMHVAAVQFPNPSVTIAYDSDADAARSQRLKVFREVAATGVLVGGAHLPFPGLGHLRVNETRYDFVPLNYATLH